MGKIKDLKGQRFGKLIAIEPTEKRALHGGYVIYKCLCDCGNYVEVNSVELKSGHTNSCGCLSSLGEAKIQSILAANDICFNKETTFPDLFGANGGRLRFDFYVDNKYLVEYDGVQHFLDHQKGMYTEERLKTMRENDKIKNEYCKEHTIPLIRIPYTHFDNITLEDLLLETTKFLVK